MIPDGGSAQAIKLVPGECPDVTSIEDLDSFFELHLKRISFWRLAQAPARGGDHPLEFMEYDWR